ncbi:MAG: Golgi nucleoside diphosphatase [Maribacter sp.]|jgi:Golgi nucleoside diphosphatase
MSLFLTATSCYLCREIKYDGSLKSKNKIVVKYLKLVFITLSIFAIAVSFYGQTTASSQGLVSVVITEKKENKKWNRKLTQGINRLKKRKRKLKRKLPKRN